MYFYPLGHAILLLFCAYAVFKGEGGSILFVAVGEAAEPVKTGCLHKLQQFFELITGFTGIAGNHGGAQADIRVLFPDGFDEPDALLLVDPAVH